MAIALGLLWWSQVQFEADMRIMDMPGPAPAFTLLIAINGPAVLPRAFWANYLSTLWDDLALIAAVGLLWYWVALNIDAWRKRRTVGHVLVDALAIGRRSAARCRGDVFRVCLRVGAASLESRFAWRARRSTPQLPPSEAAVVHSRDALLLAWSLALIYFFGRDFIHCILRKHQQKT